MNVGADYKALVAIDLGAQSCRVSLLRWHRHEPELQVIHRFPNAPVERNNELRWDLDSILRGINTGLQKCARVAQEGIASIAVDGWAVDYVRLDAAGNPAGAPFCYRDVRTEDAISQVHSIIPPSRLYSLTGIQIMRINTLYQLFADKLSGADTSSIWVNLPEYITYRLSGRIVSEYTNATHTGLVALGKQSWCEEIFDELGLNAESAPPIANSGTVLGPMAGELANLPEFHNTKIIVPACHDTASAIAAIPAAGDDWAFISSGTWSLVGTVLESPCVTDEAREMNFTNLGGVGGKIYFLKNVNGMWLLQQCLSDWEQHGFPLSVPDLIARCQALPVPETLIDIDDPQLMVPGHTLAKINSQLERLGRPALQINDKDIPVVANLIFHSMAARYAEVLARIGRITGRKIKRVLVVGGGSQNSYLNRLTAERTGAEILIGATESTTIGNFAIQLAAIENEKNSSAVSAAVVSKWAERISQAAFSSVEPQRAH